MDATLYAVLFVGIFSALFYMLGVYCYQRKTIIKSFEKMIKHVENHKSENKGKPLKHAEDYLLKNDEDDDHTDDRYVKKSNSMMQKFSNNLLNKG